MRGIAGKELPIIGSYDLQRFAQFNPEDTANWYRVPNSNSKKGSALYPSMGRKHINYLGQNVLQFPVEARANFKTRNFAYYVIGDRVYQIDKNFNTIQIANADFQTIAGNVWFAVLYTPALTYVGLTDGVHMYIYTEETSTFVTVTDPNLTGNIPHPTYIAVLGNRFVVSSNGKPGFSLSAINLGVTPLLPSTYFTVAGQAIFAQESGIIRQMTVNQNILYIFTDFTTGIWANITSTITAPDGTTSQFPFKKNTSYEFQWGISSDLSLSVDFGIMAWIGQNQSGLVQPVVSNGQAPQPISTKAIDVLFQKSSNMSNVSPFVFFDANGFLYQYENTVFYRLSAGQYQGFEILDQESNANSIEYNFDTQEWNRSIELNGERNRIQKHLYFNNMHLVTVQGEGTVYQMAGSIYVNEIINPVQSDPPNPQALDYYIANPFRYERVTPIISEPDYGEFKTEWVQIDFVWGDMTFIRQNIPFDNAVYVVAEDGVTFVTDENGNYILKEGTSTPDFSSNHYFELFKPSIELYFSNDGGITFQAADVLQFSDLGVYSWRMRWYQLGCSRNRVYKLVCVSPAPIVILGGWQLTERVSGGAA